MKKVRNNEVSQAAIGPNAEFRFHNFMTSRGVSFLITMGNEHQTFGVDVRQVGEQQPQRVQPVRKVFDGDEVVGLQDDIQKMRADLKRERLMGQVKLTVSGPSILI